MAYDSSIHFEENEEKKTREWEWGKEHMKWKQYQTEPNQIKENPKWTIEIGIVVKKLPEMTSIYVKN